MPKTKKRRRTATPSRAAGAEAFLAAAAREVEALLEAEVPRDGALWAAARYALVLDATPLGQARPKRLRPALSLPAAETCGDRAAALPAAAALECIHTYSLVHDDLPSMDDDDVRRGRPAAHAAFGIPTATRAGVALLALAFRIAGRAYKGHPRGGEIVRTLGRAAGAEEGMVGGQWLDIAGTGRAHDLATIEAIHRQKTGALIEGSVTIGALAAGAEAARVGALARAGAALGLAFQVVDDILDLEAEAEAMGKPVGADAAKGKTTVPAVLGIEGARARAVELLEEASAALAEAGAAEGPLAALARFIVERRR